MSELVADCPRCKAAQITFDLFHTNPMGVRHDWQEWHEAFCVCRKCKRATIFVLAQREPREMPRQGLAGANAAINHYMRIEGFVNLKDMAAYAPPEHLPEDIEAVFKEGATCSAVGCYNAAGTMFRLCVDIVTQTKLPAENVNGLNNVIRRNLGHRLPWLFNNGYLPDALRELSSCIKENGNDGAHEGTLQQEDAEDLLDFTVALLERLYTEPERLRLAKERREARRNGGA